MVNSPPQATLVHPDTSAFTGDCSNSAPSNNILPNQTFKDIYNITVYILTCMRCIFNATR